MFKNNYIPVMLLSGMLCCTATLFAQVDSTWQDFEAIRHLSPWFYTRNSAGLKELPTLKISSAEFFFTKNNGDYVNYSASPDSYQTGAEAESFYRLSPRMVLYGKIHYGRFEGKQMGGSVFIDPGYNPFDLVEYPDTTRGKKVLETYYLSGGVSGEVLAGFTLGGKIDYKAANYAKEKDLRHTNRLMDMNVSGGFIYQPSPLLEIGATYNHRRSVEGLDFSRKGTTDRIYHTLISYGAFMGRAERFGENGYTSDKYPLLNKFNGFSAQLRFKPISRLSMLGEFSWHKRSGFYGKGGDGEKEIEFSHHKGILKEYQAILSYRQAKFYHQLELAFSAQDMDNYENIYRIEVEEGGNKIVVYYGDNQMSEKKELNLHTRYILHYGKRPEFPLWIASVGLDRYKREQTISVYPFYRRQDVWYNELSGEVKRNITVGKNLFTPSLGAFWKWGGGNIKSDGTYSSAAEALHTPDTSGYYLYREYEYLTSSAFEVEAGLRYSRVLNPKLQGYAEINYAFTKAADILYLDGNTFRSFGLKIGCLF